MSFTDEIRHPKNYFDLIWEHKDIRSYRSMLEGGLMHFGREINNFFTQFYDKWSYLWSETRSKYVVDFLTPKDPEENASPDPNAPKFSKPKIERLAADIKEKFLEYEEITAQIENVEKIHRVRCIIINLGKVQNFAGFEFFHKLFLYRADTVRCCPRV